MARFEVTLANADKIVIDHGAPDMARLIADMEGKDLLLVREITGASTDAARDIIVVRRQVVMIRPLSDQSTQGSNFRPKR